MKKINWLPGLGNLTNAEYEVFINHEKDEYNRRMKSLCPSKALRLAARVLAKGGGSCKKCSYCGGGRAEACHAPHTKNYISALGIDPCYEGVLLRLIKETEGKEENGVALDEIDTLLTDARSLINDNFETIITLAKVIIDLIENKHHLSPESEGHVRGIAESAKIILRHLDSVNEDADPDDDDDGSGDEDYYDDDYEYDSGDYECDDD